MNLCAKLGEERVGRETQQDGQVPSYLGILCIGQFYTYLGF